MAESTPAPTNQPDPADPNPNPAAPGDAGKGTEPAQPAASTSAFDPSNVSDEDFQKIFEDKRLFTHPRFKSLNERAKKADTLEKAQAEAEKKALEDQGKFKELAEKAQTENVTLKQQLQEQSLKTAIQAKASSLGIVDLDAAALLIDRSNVKVEEDGSVTGIDEALTALLEARPYLKGGEPKKPIGTPSNPSGTSTETGTKKYKLSQLNDHKFFSENKADIMEAMKLGLVEDDIHGSPAQ